MPSDNQNTDYRQIHNTARFCVENRHVSWALLLFVIIWGIYSYQIMPKRKDPDIPVRIAMVTTAWPGHDAIEVEELVTKVVENKIAENEFLIQPSDRNFSIQSLTLPSLSMVQVQLAAGTNRDVAFNELSIKLADINNSLPPGAGPIKLNSKFGDAAAVMLSVSSPRVSDVEINLRSIDITEALKGIRQHKSAAADRAAIVVATPLDVDPVVMRSTFRSFRLWFAETGMSNDFEPLIGAGFIGVDFETTQDDQRLLDEVAAFLFKQFGATQFYPGAWGPSVLRDLASVESRQVMVAGAKHS